MGAPPHPGLGCPGALVALQEALVAQVPLFLALVGQLLMVDLFLGLSTVGCQEEEGEWVLMEVLEDQEGVLSRAACQGLWLIWSAQPVTLEEAWGRWALEAGWA